MFQFHYGHAIILAAVALRLLIPDTLALIVPPPCCPSEQP